MNKEKIKADKISKESVMFHDELPSEIVDNIKKLIDDVKSDNDKLNQVKEIYKEQIDNAVSLINDGYKIEIVINDENDLNSYMFIGYIYRENLSDVEEEKKAQEKDFNDLIEQLSYHRFDENKEFVNVKEMFEFLKSVFVKKDFIYDNKKGSLLPVIFINQYKEYNSMLQMNSNVLNYYSRNKEQFINEEYKKDDNPYILYSSVLYEMIGTQLRNCIPCDEFIVSIANYVIMNVDIRVFDSNIYGNNITFDILNIILKTKNLYLYIPVYIKRNPNEQNENENKLKSSESNEEKQDSPVENKEKESNKNKFELGYHNIHYYDDKDTEFNQHIKIYNSSWYAVNDERLKLGKDFCQTSFIVRLVNEINVGILEIQFDVNFVSPERIRECLYYFDEESYIRKEVLNVVNKYNSENKNKIELFDDLKYNHLLLENIISLFGWHSVEDKKYLKRVIDRMRGPFMQLIDHIDTTTIKWGDFYLGKKNGIFVDWDPKETFFISLLKYFIISNLSNSLIDELIFIKNNKNLNTDCEKTLLNLDKEYLEFSMLSSRDLYSSNIDYNEIEELDEKFHINDINAQYKKNLEMYKEIVDIESKKQGNNLANKLNTIQIMSILLTIIGWGLVIAQANILNKTLFYFIIIIFAAISGLLAAILINNFISKK